MNTYSLDVQENSDKMTTEPQQQQHRQSEIDEGLYSRQL